MKSVDRAEWYGVSIVCYQMNQTTKRKRNAINTQKRPQHSSVFVIITIKTVPNIWTENKCWKRYIISIIIIKNTRNW